MASSLSANQKSDAIDAAALQTSWVHRTRSGLPLCPSCGTELGFCEHSPVFSRALGKRVRRASDAASASAGPNAMVLDAAGSPDAGNDRKRTQPSRGLKRAHSQGSHAENSRKGKRPARDRKSGNKGKGKTKHRDELTLRPSETVGSSDHQASERISQSSGAGGSGAGGGGRRRSVMERETVLLGLPGFHKSTTPTKCLACISYVEGVTVSFGCEHSTILHEIAGAREKRRLSNASASDKDSPGVGSPDGETALTESGHNHQQQPHVMCLECFRIFVASRVNDCQLLTSRDFDGYTVGCPMGCANSCVDPACFEAILERTQFIKYRRFCAIHLATDMRIIWCPGCHCGVCPSAGKSGTQPGSQSGNTPSPAATKSLVATLTPWQWWRNRTGGATANNMTASVRQSNCIKCPGCQTPLCTACSQSHGPEKNCDEVRASRESEWHSDDSCSEGHDAHKVEGGRAQKTRGRVEGKGGGAREQDFASDGANEAEAGGEDAQKGTQDGSGDGLRNGVQDSSRRPAVDIGASTKRCPSCHVPIFRDGGCNHMTCGMCSYEFCWLHLTKWEVGGQCQRGHWSDDVVLNSAYNARQQAVAATSGLRGTCAIS